MNKIWFTLAVILSLASWEATYGQVPTEKFNLNVTAKNFPDSTKVVLYNRDINKNIDSAFVINGTFKFSGKVDLPSLCYLDFYDKNRKQLEAYKFFFLENENISITGDYSDFIHAKVTGSSQTDLYNKYDSISSNSKKANKLSNEVNFLFSNANNQMALNEILYKKKLISKDSLLQFYKRLDLINSNSPKGRELLNYSKTEDLKAGDKFRDIVGTDFKGKEHKLSDYAGKVILLDFWAAGCYPCRLQNKKEFPELLKKYSKDNFIIISYSLDTNEKDWRKSSKDDNITWLNITDLKGLKGENVIKYAVTAIPNSYLIDQKGTIVGTFVGFSEKTNEIEPEIIRLLK